MAPPRRIFIYWILLLVPALTVGGAAIFLLRREQDRLAEQSAEALEARRASAEARARLTVETIELLVGDAEEGLLDTLAAEPAEGLDAFLDRWEKENPLVHATFRATADGRVLRPDQRANDEDARGFLRRFPRLFGARPPWVVSVMAPALSLVDLPQKNQQVLEPEVRKDIGASVAQAQSARRGVQELVKTPSYSNTNQPTAPGAAAAWEPKAEGDKLAVADRADSPMSGASSPSKVATKVPVPAFRVKDAGTDRRGWMPAMIDGRMHLAGWIQPGGIGEVRGVELELAALVSRLGGALPAGAGAGEGYALRDDQGRVLHQVGAVPRNGTPVARVPLAAALLPGWDVVGYLAVPYEQASGVPNFLWVNTLLVAIFIAAILLGGSLLLAQARRSEEEAAQKTSFVANVSHEFKTPLTTIRLYSELLEQGRVRDAAQETDYLRTIGRETQRLARLVNNALDFSRLEQGQKKYAREPIDLVAELNRVLDIHQPRVAETGLALRRAFPPGPVEVSTDRDALEQIVLNLIDNACKYAAEGGEVLVTIRPGAGGAAEISVADRGAGVPIEHRERIFEKFHRVDEALTAEKSGAGLGLSIARQLARGLGGELRFGPREGGGAEFILSLK